MPAVEDGSGFSVVLVEKALAVRLRAAAAARGDELTDYIADALELALDAEEPLGDVQTAFAIASLPKPVGATP